MNSQCVGGALNPLSPSIFEFTITDPDVMGSLTNPNSIFHLKLSIKHKAIKSNIGVIIELNNTGPSWWWGGHDQGHTARRLGLNRGVAVRAATGDRHSIPPNPRIIGQDFVVGTRLDNERIPPAMQATPWLMVRRGVWAFCALAHVTLSAPAVDT